jgi:hypothetical protein
MRSALALAFVALVAALAGAASAADAVEGVWGPLGDDGQPRCSGTAVHVFRGGRYFRVLPNVGSTTGVHHYVMSHATYTLAGDEVSVAPALSYTNPEPRRAFVLSRGAVPVLMLREDLAARFGRCADIVIDPKGLP